MKHYSIVKLTIMLMLMLFVGKANSQSYSMNVGESLTLKVPDVPIGYVDKAIWTCPNPAIQFVHQSAISAEVKVVKAFNGYAVVGLVYVEKYVDHKGYTKANTYTKDFYIICNNGTSQGDTPTAATSIAVEPEIKVPIGHTGKIHFKLYPEGSAANLMISRWPGKHFSSMVIYKDKGYVDGHATSVGIEYVTLAFENENKEDVSSTCKVIVYDPTWTDPKSVSLEDAVVLNTGDTKKILPTFTPRNANSILDWSSDNTAVAQIDDGKITAKGSGTANITLKTSNGLMASCTVIVIDDKEQKPGIEKALKRAARMLKSSENENVK